jgi:hypothetical protein
VGGGFLYILQNTMGGFSAHRLLASEGYYVKVLCLVVFGIVIIWALLLRERFQRLGVSGTTPRQTTAGDSPSLAFKLERSPVARTDPCRSVHPLSRSSVYVKSIDPGEGDFRISCKQPPGLIDLPLWGGSRPPSAKQILAPIYGLATSCFFPFVRILHFPIPHPRLHFLIPTGSNLIGERGQKEIENAAPDAPGY